MSMKRLYKKSTIFITTILLILFVSVGVVLAAVTVDDFLTNLALTSTTTTTSGRVASGIGGELDYILTSTSGGTVIFAIDSGTAQYAPFPAAFGTLELQWDGSSDGTPGTLDHTGLGTQNLTTGPSDGFVLGVPSNDTSVGIRIDAYTDASNSSRFTFVTPGGNLERVDYFIRFTDFSVLGGSGPATFSSIGAIVLFIDGTINAGSDVAIDFIGTSSERDFGDLPTSGLQDYSAIATGNHIPRGLVLGTNVDVEPAHQGSTAANSDNSVGVDDEQGVVRSDPSFTMGSPPLNGGRVTATVNGCSGTCFLNGWIDWNNDGDFGDTQEVIINDVGVGNGNSNHTFSIPVDPSNGTFYARFRICPTSGTCNAPETADILNGEVEDYRWSFGPTAITLQNATAENPQNNMVLALVLGMVGLGITSLILHKKQRATGN